MCPFCISALAMAAAKAAATGGAAILAKVVVHKVRRESETPNRAAQPMQQSGNHRPE
ncbi:MAG TPA: hypothetical protein VJS37_02050 [Terriglobales bacterium]|nr:hypothetical protein [Terriglobales bacterium]